MSYDGTNHGSQPIPPTGPYGTPSDHGQPAPGQPPRSGFQPGAPSPAGSRGFAGIPTRDYVTDGVALLLFVISLSLAWDAGNRATDHVLVVLFTLLSLLSLSLFYLGRIGALPDAWPDRTVQFLRLLANVPYLLLVVVYVVVDVVSAFTENPGLGGFAGGIGPAIGVGLTAVVLTVVPRRSESGDPTTPGQWRAVLLGGAGLIGLFQFVALIAQILNYTRLTFSYSVLVLIVTLLKIVVLAAAAILPLVRTSAGDRAWRTVLLGLGGASLAWLLLFEAFLGDLGPWFGENPVPTTTLGTTGPLFVAALAAVALLAPAEAARNAEHRRNVARYAAIVTGSILGASVVATVLTIVAAGAFPTSGTFIARLVLLVIATIAAFAAAATASKAGLPNTPPIAAITIGLAAVAVWITIFIALAQDAGSVFATDPSLLWVAAGLPVVALNALVGPQLIATFRTQAGLGATAQGHVQGQGHGPTGQGQPGYGRAPQYSRPSAPPQSAPTPPPPGGTAAHGFTAAQASDPSTPQAVLAQIAEKAPELRSHVAANPATYDALLSWLGQLGDPAVDDALRRRPRH